MSDNTHEESTGPIKSGKQFFWVSVASFVVPFFTIIALVSWINSGNKEAPGATDTQAKVEARIQPVSKVELKSADDQKADDDTADDAKAADDKAADDKSSDDKQDASADDGADSADGAVDLAAGKELYDKTCAACHGTGAAGAPKLGDEGEWEPRIAEGMDAMMDIAINGKGAMPPRGASSASDEELRDAVLYMANEVDPDFVKEQSGS